MSTDVDDGVKREYIPVPIPVPIFMPVPMNMYSQVTPTPVSLPVPVRHNLMNTHVLWTLKDKKRLKLKCKQLSVQIEA